MLVGLTACALVGSFLSYQVGAATQHETQVSDAFEEARYAVGAEESLERKYRLEPSQEVRSLHLAAASSLLDALGRAKSLGADVELIDKVLTEHTGYLAAITRMFAAVDAGDAALANEIDAKGVDPSFGAMSAEVLDAAAGHRTNALAHLQSLVTVQQVILAVTILVFLPGVGLVAFFLLLLQRYRKESEASVARETNAIRQSERRFRSLVQNATDVVLIASATGRVSYHSPAAETAWGYGPKELIQYPLDELIHANDRVAFHELWAQLLITPEATRSIEVKLQIRDGSWRNVALILTNLLHEPSVAGLVATAHDVTERKAFEEQLTKQAFYDSLTGLPNRVLLRDRLDQALTRATRRHGSVGLLFLDLDQFKQINDSLGHTVGDELIKQAGTRLTDCVRGENTVARLGGDEFVILIDYLSEESEAIALAERVISRFAEPFRFDGREYLVTISIGIVTRGEQHDGAENMLRDADIAMYRAKNSGKARYVIFDPAMQSDSVLRLELENDLRHAISRHELVVHYQPIVELEGAHVAEVEALVRWQHPTRGLIPPADFIPIAERTGLIVALGQWVLEQACRQVGEWQKEYPTTPPLTVSVNLSPRQFQNPDLLADIKRTLVQSGLAPDTLKLEITEGTIMRDVEATISTLWQLKELGIQLAIDDFGTGFSSLAYLKRLPLDVLKIDRSFITGIGLDPEDRAIVRAIISMAKSLKLSIIAEGIETEEQSSLLREWACERGQGYYFARPLKPADLATLLSASFGAPLNEKKVA